eukprot:scaffold252_cov338-Pavlova_lutheri.AAC.7
METDTRASSIHASRRKGSHRVERAGGRDEWQHVRDGMGIRAYHTRSSEVGLRSRKSKGAKRYPNGMIGRCDVPEIIRSSLEPKREAQPLASPRSDGNAKAHDRASSDALLGSPHGGGGPGRCGPDANVALVDVSRPPAPPFSTLYGTAPSMCVFDPCDTCIVTMPRSCPLPKALVPVPKGTPTPLALLMEGFVPTGRGGARDPSDPTGSFPFSSNPIDA